MTGRWIHSLAASDDAVWATNFLDGTVSVIDARSAEVIGDVPDRQPAGGVAMGNGSVWITPHRRNVLLRIDPTSPSSPQPCPMSLARSTWYRTAYVRCSGSGSPTVVLQGNKR